MGLFSQADLSEINAAAAKSNQSPAKVKAVKAKSISNDLQDISKTVEEYFKDSKAILITDVDQLHEYVDNAITSGYVSLDTETTGLDLLNDTIVGASLYYPGGVECYIPIDHRVPIFDERRKNQLNYAQLGAELQRFVDSKTRVIFANAGFDIAMVYKDTNVDLLDVCYYDVILAWRVLKEDEKDNTLKGLYNKYVLRGKGDPKKFSDFFSVATFPYCKPEVAKLYAANDAKITFELFQWQLPYVTKSHPKCQKANLEALADLFWNTEIPLIRVCQMLHRRGVYLDKAVASSLHTKYEANAAQEEQKLADLVQPLLDQCDHYTRIKCPFRSGSEFNPNSSIHVSYLCKNILKLDIGKSLDKNVLHDLNLPVTNQIIAVRNMRKLLSTYVDKLPKVVGSDSKVHAKFKSIGADTGRMSSEDPNMQNIPSHAGDIRHMFRATAAHSVVLDCAYNAEFDEISVDVPKFNTVTVLDRGDVHVSDLAEGDVVKLLSEGKEIYKRVKQISVANTDAKLCHVVF